MTVGAMPGLVRPTPIGWFGVFAREITPEFMKIF
jgi:hypothetical protein